MNLAQNVCVDDFKVIYIFLSSDFLKFFRLGQFSVIIGPTEWFWYLWSVCVKVSFSVTIAPTASDT